MKYSMNKEMDPASGRKWKDFAIKFNPEDLYVGGICGLYYNYNVFEFLNKQEPNDHVSVLFISNSIGSDKQRLLITGDHLVTDEQISMPFDYIGVGPQFTRNILENHLRKIDEEFNAKNKNITLVLNVPLGFLDGLKLTNINLIAFEHLDVIEKTDALAKYIKTNYRKLQIIKTMQKMQIKTYNFNFMEYIYLISMAWNNVPYEYIRKIFYYNVTGVSNCNEIIDLSLSSWCKINKVPINEELLDSLDSYVNCDDKIEVFNLSNVENNLDTRKVSHNNSYSVSGIEAYQAMKRLVSYLQSRNADATVATSARCLENHMEYEALLEMHDYVKSENDNV